MTLSKPQVDLLVTDLDNTLWNWFEMWHVSFDALVVALSDQAGIDRDVLEGEMRQVHQSRGTTEYSFLVDELPSLIAVSGSQKPSARFDDAIHQQNSLRKKTLALYPRVLDTLRAVRSKGVPVVAYTESISYWTERRIRTLGLDGVIDVLYSSPDHDFPLGLEPADVRTLPPEEYGLHFTEHKQVPRGALKPNPGILQSILDEQGVDARRTVYVGDSLTKDVAMAKSVGAIDVLAAYGIVHNSGDYELLRRVTHWTQADVERERRSKPIGTLEPTYKLDAFGDLLDLFSFGESSNGA
jgi:FMN phosphatase YigB (HAD superfamily)